jgi:hypothetical protein
LPRSNRGHRGGKTQIVALVDGQIFDALLFDGAGNRRATGLDYRLVYWR